MRGFCPRDLCPKRAYVLRELCMDGVLSERVLSAQPEKGQYNLGSVFRLQGAIAVLHGTAVEAV